jgi:hypothetical protein
MRSALARVLAASAVVAALTSSATSQDHAFIGVMAVYPPGGAAGTTVEVDLRYHRRGVQDVTVSGSGITASLLKPKEEAHGYDWQPSRGYPIFQNKCGACHALPNPVVLRRTREEWQRIVETMVKKHGAPISLAGELSEGRLIAQYLGKATQDAVGLRARFVIAPDAPPGRREVRMVGRDWTSQIGIFEVTRDREVLEAGGNTTLDAAQALHVPVTVSGQLNEAGETDYYALDLRAGQRVTIRCASATLNARHFFPRVGILDASSRLLARNEGRGGFDPFLDFTAAVEGRVYVAVDDLFSRGSPEMVYRLKIEETPYDAALFPPGLRRGSSVVSALVGENAEAPPVPLSAGSEVRLGVHHVKTPRGAFPYVVGDYPDHLRTDGPIRLPAALNGRFLQPGQRDRYPLTVTPEEVGKPVSFEVFGGRIGSPAELSLSLVEGEDVRGKTPLLHSERNPYPYAGKFDTNWPAYKLGAQLYGRDERFDVVFPRPGLYSLEVWEAGGRSGPGFVYRIHAGPAEPDFSVAITPDNPTVSPGASVYLEIHPLRRYGIEGPIEVTLAGLPPGITASTGVLRPGHARSFLTLTAAPDAKPGLVLRTRPTARALAGGQLLVRAVVPYEFRDHCRPPIPTDELVVTVGRPPAWTVRLETEPAGLAPGRGLPLKIKLARGDAKDGDVPFFLFADHKDVRFSGLPSVPSGSSESTVTVRLEGRSAAAGRVRIVVVNGLNEWIGVTSGAMNRSSAALELDLPGGAK